MLDNKLKRIVFLRVLAYEPQLQNFSARYQNLPICFDSHVIVRSHDVYEGITMGQTVLHTIPLLDQNVRFKNFRIVFHIIKKALRLQSIRKIDVIHAYDPLTLGVTGVLLKKLTGARLIIEVNGHLLTAGFLGKLNFATRIKRIIYRIIIGYVLRHADVVKLLNRKMFEEHIRYLQDKKVVYFGDYVPTASFTKSEIDDKYIFFAGFPFFLKGVDILIKAFLKLTDDFPEYRLVVLGFNPVDLESYQKMADACTRIEFHKSVPYNQMIRYMERCTFLVLPSRSEAMGRVLIEAMACGKAVIGSRVGGIPEVIDDQITGLLFESESVDELEVSIRRLLSDPALRKHMGNNGYKKMRQEYATEIYMAKFTSMLMDA
jgi:glycosyltransferase involved in cell wall biosynthesis